MFESLLQNNIFLTYTDNKKLQSEYNELYNSLVINESSKNKVSNKRGPKKKIINTSTSSEKIQTSLLQNSLLSKALVLPNNNISLTDNNTSLTDNNTSMKQLLNNIDNVSSSSSIRDSLHEE